MYILYCLLMPKSWIQYTKVAYKLQYKFNWIYDVTTIIIYYIKIDNMFKYEDNFIIPLSAWTIIYYSKFKHKRRRLDLFSKLKWTSSRV